MLFHQPLAKLHYIKCFSLLIGCISRADMSSQHAGGWGGGHEIILAAVIIDPLGSINCRRSKPEIEERSHVFAPQMINPSGSIISTDTILQILLRMDLAKCRWSFYRRRNILAGAPQNCRLWPQPNLVRSALLPNSLCATWPAAFVQGMQLRAGLP
jgi:hypothetical protein